MQELNKKKKFPFKRAGGILLHPSSLPGELGIGNLGKEAFKFIDFLKRSELKVWQILPLNPTGYGNSPYQGLSTFAGNQNLISIEKIKAKYAISIEMPEENSFNKEFVDFGKVIPIIWETLKNIYQSTFSLFMKKYSQKMKLFEKENYHWLDDYSLFMVFKQMNDDKSWQVWDENQKFRDPETLNNYKKEFEEEINFHKWVQFIFFDQWNDLKQYAKKNGIFILGDVPIYVALDSVDVWSNQNLFRIENGVPTVVTGVPPDYFSKTGQRWGNPVYDWKKMEKNKFQWWIKRLKFQFSQFDFVRLDHFRGFESYWEIPADQTTAINGRWVSGPSKEFFYKLEKEISSLPIIAEDLGVITNEVDSLREEFNYPGMRILQFAFDNHKFVEERFLPYNFHPNTVVYTGTHDNETLNGWWKSKTKEIKKRVLEYLNSSEEEVISNIIRLAWQSVAFISIIPMQDFLRLDNKARMNLPGNLSGNWEWRFNWGQLKDEFIEEIRKFSILYGRN